MSLLVLSPDTVRNPGLLKFSTAPRKILQRGTILPKGAPWGVTLRAIFESQVLRLLFILLPFVAAGLTWPQIALPLGSAPIIMLVAIGLVEMRLLRIPKSKRDRIGSDAEAARALDTLTFRGRRILAQLAAGRGIESGTLYLVVEQSDMARIPPLTIASLQLGSGKTRLAKLTAEERAIIEAGLFDDAFTEHHLFLANQREGVTLRSVAFEAQGVSAHARLAAFLNAPTDQNKAPA